MTTSPPPPARLQVHLPPRRTSDFVIHHRDTDYHTHSFVLHHQSAYFRHYFDALQPLRDAEVKEVTQAGILAVEEAASEEVREQKAVVSGEGRSIAVSELGGSGSSKKRKTDALLFHAAFTRERTSRCGHSPLIHCIDLPDQCGVRETSGVHFLSFLRHLYYSSTLHLPPYHPKPSILAAISDDTPICLTFPTSSVTSEDISGYAQRSEDNKTEFVSLELLSLFDYFACEAALKRCEAVILTDCNCTPKNLKSVCFWLPLTVAYGLGNAEAECLRLIREQWRRRLDAKLREGMQRLTPAMRSRVVEACCSDV